VKWFNERKGQKRGREQDTAKKLQIQLRFVPEH